MDNLVPYSFDIRSMTADDIRKLLYSGNDTHDNQIRVSIEGIVYLSEVVGANSLSGVLFRFETFDANNGLVGPKAAADNDLVERIYTALKNNWIRGNRTYIDLW